MILWITDEYVEVELISEENDTSIENTCIAVSNVIDTVTNNVSPKKCASKTERKPMKKNIVQGYLYILLYTLILYNTML